MRGAVCCNACFCTDASDSLDDDIAPVYYDGKLMAQKVVAAGDMAVKQVLFALIV